MSTCYDCGKVICTQSHYYGDMRKSVMTEDGYLCLDCLRANPVPYLEGLEGVTDRAVKVPHVDPAAHGYKPVDVQFQNGFHPGQTDDPKKIGGRPAGCGSHPVHLRYHRYRSMGYHVHGLRPRGDRYGNGSQGGRLGPQVCEVGAPSAYRGGPRFVLDCLPILPIISYGPGGPHPWKT